MVARRPPLKLVVSNESAPPPREFDVTILATCCTDALIELAIDDDVTIDQRIRRALLALRDVPRSVVPPAFRAQFEAAVQPAQADAVERIRSLAANVLATLLVQAGQRAKVR